MRVIHARNAGLAWPEVIQLILSEGVPQETRAGRALALPEPLAVVYAKPQECVIFDPVRDANPIFHVMESLWLLAGRDDATWLDNFVSDFSKRFAQSDGRMHGSYGKRWRDHFPLSDYEGWAGPSSGTQDQLTESVNLLIEDPQSRQVVITMWNPVADLGVKGLADRPCNLQVLLRTDRIVNGKRVLDMTVTNRSNDVVFGMLGANAVHFSQLQQYLAARIGVDIGTYTQFAHNAHIYDWSLNKVDQSSAEVYSIYPLGYQAGVHEYPGVRPLVDDPETFDDELHDFLYDPDRARFNRYGNSHFERVAYPMWRVNDARLQKKWDLAAEWAQDIDAPDWRRATLEWIERRRVRKTKDTRE